jgi:hypothetical protein
LGELVSRAVGQQALLKVELIDDVLHILLRLLPQRWPWASVAFTRKRCPFARANGRALHGHALLAGSQIVFRQKGHSDRENSCGHSDRAEHRKQKLRVGQRVE